jgi:predicted aspartyl protease
VSGWPRAVVLLVGAVAAACASPPAATGPGNAIAPTVVAIQLAGGSTFVSVEVNTRDEAALFLLDTGSSLTVLTPLYAQRLGIAVPFDAKRRQLTGIGGHKVSVPLVTVAHVRVGGAVVENLTVGVYNAIPDVPMVDGILGLDFLRRFKFTVDTAGKVLRLEPFAVR